MRRNNIANLIIMCFFATSFSQGRFLLQSEIKTSYNPGSTTARLTTYAYDNHGKKIKMLVFLGADTATGLDNSAFYSYDANQRMVSELHLLSGVDTSSLINYSYDANSNLSVIRTMVNNNGVWQVDSLKYDSSQRLVQRWHYTAAITDYHDYTYNISGQEIADTLLESTGAAYVATQASIFDYSVPNIVTQKDYFVTGGTWYFKQDSVKTYANNFLVASAVHEPNGVTNILMDSLAFSYDTAGNKVNVAHFDKTGARTYAINYQWFPNPYAAILVRNIPERRAIELAYSKRIVTLRHSESSEGYLAVFTLNGKLYKKQTVMAGQNYAMALPGIAPGKYIAEYLASGIKQSLLINVGN
jgi:hypothetical protein